MATILCLIYCLLIVWNVNSLEIEGPPIMRYQPCGLGTLYFEEIENNWRGVIDFERYKHDDTVEFVIRFKEDISIDAPQNDFVTTRRNDKRDFIVQATKPVPDYYTFPVQMDNHDSDVPILTSLTVNNVNLCNEKIRASNTISSLNVTRRYPGKQYAHVCGRRSMNKEVVSLRTVSQAGDWPWHVAVFVKRDKTMNYVCGGNVVSKTAIVTVGYCVVENGTKIEPDRFLIMAGINNVNYYKQQVGKQEIKVEEIVLHPSFEKSVATANLAIVKVKNIEFTEYVQPICVLGPVYDKREFYGKEGLVTGFGRTEKVHTYRDLRATNLMIQNDSTCIESADAFKLFLNEFTFCAGYGPTSRINPTKGDGGSGLIVSKTEFDNHVSYYLHGITSKCVLTDNLQDCNTKYYSVYTDVAPHYGWIYHHSGLQLMGGVIVA